MIPKSFRLFAFSTVLVLAALFSSVSTAYSAQVTLQWEPNDSNVDGYQLYSRLENQSQGYETPVWSGTETSCKLTVADDTGYYFVVRATRGDQESSDSNEVYYKYTSDTGDQNPSGGSDTNGSGGDGGTSGGDDSSNTTDDNTGNGPVDGADDAPLLVSPVMANGVSLTPELLIGSTDNSKAGVPVKTHWQIALDQDFSQLVFDLTSKHHLMALVVPEMILDMESEYYWRVRWIGEDGQAGTWSKAGVFVTIASDASEDMNFDGIPDFQELSTYAVDLDNNGQPDMAQDDIMCVNTSLGNAVMGIKSETHGASVVSVKSIGEDAAYDTDDKPESMDMGLVSFKLFLDEGITTAHVTIYFSEPAPAGAEWYKYNCETGWRQYESAVFSDDRRSITITFEDGGLGDDDGVRNGIIVDPSGLAFRATNPQANIATLSGAEGASGGGCFISEVTAAQDANSGTKGSIFLILLLLGGGIVGTGRRCKS